MSSVTFLGAAGTVTGSRHLVRAGGAKLLIDCGLFQGLKQLRLRNRQPLGVDPASLDAVLLTHAHLDHTGWLPLLVRQGYAGAILATRATIDLCGLLLPDAAHLEEERAEHANRHGYSRHHPALPLFTREDADRALRALAPIEYDTDVEVAPGVVARFLNAGHIAGSALILLEAEGQRVLFTGDLGRPHDPLLDPPARPPDVDMLVLESTYGDRLHPREDPADVIADAVARTAARGGCVIVPAFAVGRTQELLYHLARLAADGRIPDLPVFLDSPMAARATALLEKWPPPRGEPRIARDVLRAAVAVPDVEGSKQLDRSALPRVIIAGSGMATGGRVIHHLKALGGDPRNTILFTGFQAPGTRGAAIVAGADSVKIHGQHVPIRAEVVQLHGLSSHADQAETLEWLGGFHAPPSLTCLVHGEPPAADALRLRIEERLRWPVLVAEHRQAVPIPARRKSAATPAR